jgi:hypothetical protein
MLVRLLLAAAALSGAAPAQAIAGSFSLNPVAPTVPVRLTCTDTTGLGAMLPSPCGWFQIHQGSQAGPIVQLSVGCGQVIVPVAPNGTFSFNWNQRDSTGAFVPPGQYWFEVLTYDPAFTSRRTDWFPISIQSPPTPALTATGPARVGMVTPMQISAPLEPGAVYAAALAFTSNVPLVVLGLQSDLDASLTFDFLQAPVGALDTAGQSAGLALAVPNTPIALWQGAHVQALIAGNAGLQLTNSIAFTVQP